MEMMMMMTNSLDVSHARMVLCSFWFPCVAYSLFPHQFHGTVDFWNSSNLKIHDGALFAWYSTVPWGICGLWVQQGAVFRASSSGGIPVLHFKSCICHGLPASWVGLIGEVERSSGFRKKYLYAMHNVNEMKKVYNRLQERLDEEYKDVENFPVCFRRQQVYYEELIE